MIHTSQSRSSERKRCGSFLAVAATPSPCADLSFDPLGGRDAAGPSKASAIFIAAVAPASTSDIWTSCCLRASFARGSAVSSSISRSLQCCLYARGRSGLRARGFCPMRHPCSKVSSSSRGGVAPAARSPLPRVDLLAPAAPRPSHSSPPSLPACCRSTIWRTEGSRFDRCWASSAPPTSRTRSQISTVAPTLSP